MKKTIFAMMMVVSINYSFASNQVPSEFSKNLEIFYADENLEVPKTKISDVKELLSSMNPEATCMDEYLQRRNQLILKLSLSPITIVVGTAISGYTGAMGAGLLADIISNPATGVYADRLIYVVYGLLGGFTAGAAGTITDTNMAAFQLSDIDTIVKALAEQYRNESGKKSDKLYARFSKKQENPISKEVFLAKLMEMDANGKLCDGSLVKQPRFKLGSRLKFKVARTKHLRKAI